VRAELQRLHVGTFTGPAGTFRQRTELTAEQRAILGALGPARPAPRAQRHPGSRLTSGLHRA
jgi:hypothetical protein